MNRPNNRAENESGTPRLVKVLAMLLMPLLAFAIASCDSGQAARNPYQDSPEGKPSGSLAPVPDPKEVVDTKQAGAMPDFLASVTGPAHDHVMALYQGAVDNYDAYSHMPCYCGCAIYTTAHKSLAQCYIKEMKADGTIAFTDHSTSCDLCQTAAQMTLDGISKSTPLKQVRSDIFQKLKYTGIWTDTPPVQ